MAKIVLDPVTNGGTLSTLNANFDKIESEFQNRVLYRDNVSGETNTVVNDIDMDGNNISNIDTVFTQALVVNGVVYEVVLQGFVDAATAQAAIATAQAIIATNQANTSGAHAAASLNSANNSAASAADALASELAAAASAASIANGPVFSFNGRFGVVTLTETDVLNTGVLEDAALTGVPTAPTAAAGTTTTQIATTAFVAQNATNAPPLMDGVATIGTSTRHSRADHVHPSDTTKANLESPTFTGTVIAPTLSAANNTNQVATTAFVKSNNYAPLASPTFTGTPAAPTATAGTNTTQLATTAFVTAAAALKANLASPTFTGTPAAPTATAGTNTTQLATTAFVTAAAALKANLASPPFTGVPLSTTAAVDTNTTQIATTAFVIGQGYAKLVSPTFTGTPLAPTAGAGTSTTQLATTAFVAGEIKPGAWTSMSISSVASSAGTLTNATATGFQRKVGRTVEFTITISIINNGTGSGSIQVTIPYTLANTFIFAGRENALTGNMLQAIGPSGSATISIFKYDGTYPAATGASLIISGTLEATT